MSTAPESKKKRSAGAPKGNTNALKHGMYSASLKARVIGQTPATPLDGLDLTPEIELLRVLINRAVLVSQSAESLEDVLNSLRIISLASFTLTRLMRAQQVFNPSQPWFDDLTQAMQELQQEMQHDAAQSDTGTDCSRVGGGLLME